MCFVSHGFDTIGYKFPCLILMSKININKFCVVIQLMDLVHFLVKCSLKGLLKMIKLMLILGQIRLSKGKLCPAGLVKDLVYYHAGLELEIEKKLSQNYFQYS